MKDVLLLGITGGTGSGKSTLAAGICKGLELNNVAQLQQDSYYKDISHIPIKERDKINFDHPEAFDNQLLGEHLSLLKARKPVARPIYDFYRHIRQDETVIIQPSDLIVLEGITILAVPAIRNLLDLKIYVDTDDDSRFIRRLMRDIGERGRTVQSVIKQYEETVKPMHLDFVEPSKKHADIILPGNGSIVLGVQVICGYIKDYITEIG